MVFVHVDPQLFERHPWAGVLLGLAGGALAIYMTSTTWDEWRRLEAQGQPRDVTVSTAVLPADGGTLWATLTDGAWDCAGAVEREHGFPERLLFGRLDETEVPVLGGPRLLVVKLPAELRCQDAAEQPVTGVLMPEGQWGWGGSVARALLARPHQGPVLVLRVGIGPDTARSYFGFSTLLLLLSAGVAGWYGRKPPQTGGKWTRRRESAIEMPEDTP